MTTDVLPRDARLIALLISTCPAILDAQPAVLHQLLEFAHRYTSQVLSDALVYSEHAGRGGSLSVDDVRLAVQSRVGWEFGGKVPKEFMLSLAAKVNSKPLPSVPEVFGVRLPPAKHCLTAVDFDLLPNKPPPGFKLNEGSEEDDEEEGYEDDGDEDDAGGQNDDMEMADVDQMTGEQKRTEKEGSKEGEEEGDDLFGEGEEDEPMANLDEGGLDTSAAVLQPLSSGVGEKRKIDEEDDDYDA